MRLVEAGRFLILEGQPFGKIVLPKTDKPDKVRREAERQLKLFARGKQLRSLLAEAYRAINNYFLDKVQKAEDREEETENAGLVFEDEEKRLKIMILSEDGVRVPASNLFYRFENEFIIGEITYCHAILSKEGLFESVEYETIVPVLVWARYKNGEIIERSIKPYQMAQKLEIAGKPILIELKTRYAGTLSTLMGLEVAKSFVDGVAEPPSWREIYESIVASIRSFVSYYWDERLYKVNACWIIATYFSEMWSAFPYLYYYASPGMGKSRAAKTTTYLSKHGFVVTDPSEASLYRMAEAFRPTLCIDESLLGNASWKIIRTAFKKGTMVPRVEKTSKEEFVLSLFETYMPVCFASTERPSEIGGSEADESRAIFIYMQRAPDPIGRDPESWDFQELRDKLYLLRLLRANDVIEALRKIESANLGLYGHDREVWLPILTIASLIGEDVYRDVLEYAMETIAIKEAYQYQNEKVILRAILFMYRNAYREAIEEAEARGEKRVNVEVPYIAFKASDLRHYVKEALIFLGEFSEAGFNKYWTNHRIGIILTKMGLFKSARRGCSLYKVTAEDLRDLFKRYYAGMRVGLVGLVGLGKKGLSEKIHSFSQQREKKIYDFLNAPFSPTPTNPTNPTQKKIDINRCGDCRFYERGKCLKHREWVVVTPDHPACELFEPKEKEEGKRGS